MRLLQLGPWFRNAPVGLVWDRFWQLRFWDWGVPNIWLIDPRLGQLAHYGTTGLIEVIELALPEFHFSVTLKDLLP